MHSGRMSLCVSSARFRPPRVRERNARRAQSKPLLGHWGFTRPRPGLWRIGDWRRLRRDRGVRARFVADDQVVLEQWTQVTGRLTVDSCRIELVRLEPGGEQDPPLGGTVLGCHFFVPAEPRPGSHLE